MSTRVKYNKNCLFWYIDVETKSIGYFDTSASLEDLAIDPKTHIVGIFVGDP